MSESNGKPKPSIVLMAGLLCDDAIWEAVRTRLADAADITTVSFDGLDSIGAMAERTLAAAPPRAVFIGHSMGGRVALEASRLAPRRVRAMALLNTGVHPVGASEPASRGALVALARDAGMSALAAEWLPPMMNEGVLLKCEVQERLTAMVERSTPSSFEKQINALLQRPDARAPLAAFKGPVLLVSATGDKWSPVSQHEAMRTLAPHAELRVIANAGHMAPVEQPDDVANAITAWLQSLGEDTSSDVEAGVD